MRVDKALINLSFVFFHRRLLFVSTSNLHHAYCLSPSSFSSLCSLLRSLKTYRQIDAKPRSNYIFPSRFHLFARSHVSTTDALPITPLHFSIDHSWPVHGVSFPFAADTRGRAQFRRVPFGFCILVSILPFTCIFTFFPCCTITPLLDMTLDDLHIFTWI